MRAVALTHGHEDHVGGLPYLLREVDVETVVSTRLTLGLVEVEARRARRGRRRSSPRPHPAMRRSS